MDNIYCHVVATLYITFSRIFYEYECYFGDRVWYLDYQKVIISTNMY